MAPKKTAAEKRADRRRKKLATPKPNPKGVKVTHTTTSVMGPVANRRSKTSSKKDSVPPSRRASGSVSAPRAPEDAAADAVKEFLFGNLQIPRHTPKRPPIDINKFMGPVANRASASSAEPAARAVKGSLGATVKAGAGLAGLLKEFALASAPVDGGGGGGGGVGAPPTLPDPSLDSYLAPYIQAEEAARKGHELALPVINQSYDGLAQQFAAQQADVDRQNQLITQKQAGNFEQLTNDVSAEAAIGKADLASHFGSNVQAGVASDMVNNEALGAQRANEQQANQTALIQRMAEVQQQGTNARTADADLAQTAAVANAQNNLGNLLQQIGLGKADATRQYEQEKFSRDMQQASLAADFAKMNASASQDAAAAEQDALAQRQEALSAASTTPAKLFQARSVEYAQKYPRGWTAFNDIIGEAGGGTTGYANAMQVLNTIKPALIDGSYLGAKINPTRIASWLKDYYDDQSEVLDPQKASFLGFG